MEGLRGVEEAFGRGEIPGLDEVGNARHLVMKRGVEVDNGAVFRRVAEVSGVVREKPLADRTLFRMMDGVGSAFGERLVDRDSEQEG